MKKNAITLIIAANLAILVLLAFFMPQPLISPGRNIEAHAEFSTDCFACHTPFIGSTPEKCVACHEVAEIGLKTTRGVPIAGEKKNVAFHQELLEDDCVACHSDHKGVQAFRPISQFSHDLLRPALQEQCDSCHANPGDSLHLKIQGSCGLCHTQQAWLPATFDHDEYFRFDRHHETACETCHVDNNYAGYTCYGCHEHSRSKIREEHLEEGIRDYENCVECHRSGDEDEAERIWRSKRYGGERMGPASAYGSRERDRRDGHDGEDDDD